MDDDELEVTAPDDISADIRSAAESLGSKLVTSEDKTPAPEAEPEARAERARDETGKFVKADTAVEQPKSAPDKPITDAVQSTEQPAQPSPAGAPPRGWSAEEKALWSQLPPAIQTAVSRREAQMDEGARQWTQQRQAVEQAIAPLHELSQQNGINWQDGLQRLLNVESGLRNPQTAAQTVQQIAQAYGVDLAALVNGSPQPQRPAQPSFDPNIIPQIVQQTVSQQFQAFQQDQALNGEIQQFATERGADGQLAHPHFSTVKTLMGHLLQSGQAEDMQDAYDKAIWANSDIRSQLLTTQAKPQSQQIEKARKAAITPKGAPNSTVKKGNGFDPKQSLEDDLREAMAQFRN